ncbi:amidohydrolase family protein [Brevundimonas sp.]|uniref:amidohydrolase family protein n=1 Tax=Brevundimonas sp. TaxID=1871086 RepID=UPI0028B17750|nr:amidohydrolase family protein [Brevundimonas sp.]
MRTTVGVKAIFKGAGAACAAALLLAAGTPSVVAAQAQTQAAPARATLNPAPPRRADEGFGPYPLMVVRGAMLIDGTGAPPMGPVDIVIENDKITDVIQAGWPGMPEQENRRPLNAAHEIDARGMYVMPGFVDAHAHGGSPQKAPDLEYVYKLWLAHGVTTVRGVSLAPHDIAVSEKARSARGEIVAPRIYNYQTLGSGWSRGRIRNPEMAREWVRWGAANGVDGIKFFLRGDETPEVVLAAIDEAKKNHMGTVAHIAQPGVAQLNAEQLAAAGLGTITHFYGHFESLLGGRTIQDYPTDYNFYDEQKRFGEAAEIWDEVEPGSAEWYAYLEAQKKAGVVFDPTMTIYAASRDLMRARNAPWHQTYTLPALADYFQSTRDNHGSYFFDWTTSNEVAWRRFYERFMRLVNDYKKVGGRVTVGSDSGFIWKLYGFGYIEELELLQEAGFHPLEIVRAATMDGATTLAEPTGKAPTFGIVRPGMSADLVITTENPLANFKTLYGTGHERLSPENRIETVGGVRWTVARGVAYDAPALLADVRAMVDRQKAERGEAQGGR